MSNREANAMSHRIRLLASRGFGPKAIAVQVQCTEGHVDRVLSVMNLAGVPAIADDAAKMLNRGYQLSDQQEAECSRAILAAGEVIRERLPRLPVGYRDDGVEIVVAKSIGMERRTKAGANY